MAQLYNRRVLRGGLFLAHDIQMQRPLNWRGGEQIFRQAITGITDIDGFWLQLGARLKEELSLMIQSGEIPADPPLSDFTKIAKGNDHYLDDDGTFADSFQPRLMKTGKVIGGYAGVALIPSSTPSAHSRAGRVITNLRLLDILCQQGMIVYADEMDPKALQRLLAWRAQFLEEDRSPLTTVSLRGYLKWLDTWLGATKATYPRYMTALSRMKRGARLSEDDQDLLRYVDEKVGQARGMGFRVVNYRSVAGQLDKGRKPVIFIPPRPLFVPPVLARLKRVARDALGDALRQIVKITAHSLGYEPWDPASVHRHEANIRAIGLWGQEKR